MHVALAVTVHFCTACSSNHHVSPWGSAGPPPLSAFAAPDDLQGNLHTVDAEIAALGLTLKSELRANLQGGQGPVVARGYEGVDATGRSLHAVRVATSQGIIMALGPRDSNNHATQLVVSLLPVANGNADDGAFRSLTDLNGDGSLDIALRGGDGTIEVHSLFANGSTQYDVQMSLRPSEVIDCDDDGYPDLVGRPELPDDDPIAPSFIDVATFDRGRYRSSSDEVIAFHARRAKELRERARKSEVSAPSEQLRIALERSWHEILAGSSASDVVAELERRPVPTSLRSSFERHVALLSKLRASRPPPSDKPTARSAH